MDPSSVRRAQTADDDDEDDDEDEDDDDQDNRLGLISISKL
ncbi:hypothetical protein CGRA01v4_12060 [Colletotrichum graminicola]|nr:hypothetical protein CGRA01v4_12060 [Colletotrichum graminicola]